MMVYVGVKDNMIIGIWPLSPIQPYPEGVTFFEIEMQANESYRLVIDEDENGAVIGVHLSDQVLPEPVPMPILEERISAVEDVLLLLI